MRGHLSFFFWISVCILADSGILMFCHKVEPFSLGGRYWCMIIAVNNKMARCYSSAVNPFTLIIFISKQWYLIKTCCWERRWRFITVHLFSFSNDKHYFIYGAVIWVLAFNVSWDLISPFFTFCLQPHGHCDFEKWKAVGVRNRKSFWGCLARKWTFSCVVVSVHSNSVILKSESCGFVVTSQVNDQK